MKVSKLAVFLSFALLIALSGCAQQTVEKEVVKKEVVIIDMMEKLPTDEMSHDFCMEACSSSALEGYVNDRYNAVYGCKCINKQKRYFSTETGEELTKEQIIEMKEN